MPVVNPLARELVFKVVYYGPGLGGKTTSLQHLHATAKPEHRGKMVSLATPVDRTLYFDFLPIRVPSVRGMSVRLQLFTVPGQVYYNATRKLVLTGADGIVAVFDSQRARSDANLESLENLIENLRAHGRELGLVPHVIQYNKRDLYDVAGLNELEQQLNLHGAPSFATTATAGEGIYESLEAITRAVLEDFERRMPDTRGLPAASLELPEGGLVDALRRAENDAPAAQRNTFTRVSASSATSSSGEYRLSQLPEVDPGEAAARAAAGHPEELVPRARQTWPLPGAPDERRSAPHQVSNAVPLAANHVPSAAPAAPSPVPPVAEPNGRIEAEQDGFELGPESMQEPDYAPRAPLAGVAPAPGPAPAAAEVVPARAPAEGETGPALSFEQLWPTAERMTVRELEGAIVHQNHTRAIMLSEQLIARSLAGAASALGGTPDAPRDPFTVVLVLGIDRRRYLEYRTLVRDARAGRTMSASEALMAYALAIETRLSRLSLTG